MVMKFRKGMLLITLSVVVIVVSMSRVLSKEDDTVMMQTPVNLANYKGVVSWVDQPPTQQPDSVNIVGIHGTPGSWTAWRAIMAEPLMAPFHFYAYDRPGWGQSQSNDQRVISSLTEQADILAVAIQKNSNHRANIIIAHSWGGPVALALAANYPELVDGLVLIAAPASPKASKPRWYHKLANITPVQWLIGRSMTRSNKEMIQLDKELQALAPSLKKITAPTVIMQGKKDWLVAPENAFYLKEQLSMVEATLLYDLTANHFIPFKQSSYVAEQIQFMATEL